MLEIALIITGVLLFILIAGAACAIVAASRAEKLLDEFWKNNKRL